MKNKDDNFLPEENPDKAPASVNWNKLRKEIRLSLSLRAMRDQGAVLRVHSWASHHPHTGPKPISVVPTSSPCSGPHEEKELSNSASASKAREGPAPTPPSPQSCVFSITTRFISS